MYQMTRLWESSLRMKINLCPIGGFSTSVEISAKISCFFNEAYSAYKEVFHCGQSSRFIAWSSVVGSVLGVESRYSVVKWTLGSLDCHLVGVLGAVRLAGRVRPVSGIGLWMTRSMVKNPSKVWSTKVLSLMSLMVSVLAKEVGRSGLDVSVSGTPKFKGWDGLGWIKVGNTISMNLQFANLILNKCPVMGSKYRMIKGESYPT